MNSRLRIRIDEGLSIKNIFSKLRVKASSSPDVLRVLQYIVNNPNILIALRKTLGEAITVPIEIGDTVLGGKFKNRRIEVKDIGKNEKGDITINGKPLLKYRLLQKEEKINEMDYEKLLPIQLSTIARIMGEMQMANRKGNSPTVKRLYKKLVGMIKILEKTVTNL